MNQSALRIGSVHTTEVEVMVTFIPSDSNVDITGNHTSQMQLRGGDPNSRPPAQGRKHQGAPAWQRKALGISEDPVKDVQGHKIVGQIDRFECSMNPSKNNRFEALRVQSLDWCHEPNATWHRTKITNGTPWALRCAFWFWKGIPLDRRNCREDYTRSDYFSLLWRFLPAGLATSVAVSQLSPTAKAISTCYTFRMLKVH